MLPRREFLRGLSALSVFSLAGCSDDGEGTDTLTETTRPGTTTVPFTVTETLHDPSTATTTQQTADPTTALTTTPATETETSTDMVVAQSDPDTDSSQPTSTATQSTTSTTTTSPTDTMTDQVFWQDGDSASPENLSQLRAQTNSSDYVERGVTFTPDYANNELDIATGHAVIYDESTDRAYDVFPDARTNLALTDAATNYVFLMCDPDNVTGSGVDDDVGYHIDTDDTPPTATETSSTTISLKVGEVDTTATATSTAVNRDPAVSTRSIDTEQLNTRVFTVGPDAGNKYQSLATAMDDLRGQGSVSARYTLYLTGDLTGSDAETEQIEPASYVNVEGNGYAVESTYDQGSGIRNRDGFEGATWSNFTFDFTPATDPGFSDAIYIGYRSDRNVVMENVTVIGHDKGAGGNAWALADNSNAELRNCVGVGGDGGNGCSGISFKFGCTPNIVGGTFYGGNGGDNCYGISIGASSTPTLTNVTGVIGQGGKGGNGIRVVDSAAPTMTGCTGRPKQYAQNLSGAVGGDSDTVDAGYPVGDQSAPMDSTGWPSVLLSIQLRVLTAATGATIDLGTTAGGTEIASGIDASSTDRKFFDYNRVRFVSGDEIHVSTSDSSVELNLRYTLAVDNNASGLMLDTYGEASISNCQFRSGTRAPAASIGSNSTTAKKYTLANSDCVPVDEAGQDSITGTSDSGAEDPIHYCATPGGTTNITPAQ